MSQVVRRIDHTAVVVGDLDSAVAGWQTITGGRLETRERIEHQGVEVAMLLVGDTRLELINPTETDNGVARFLAKRGESLHHIGLLVDDIAAAIDEFRAGGFELIDPEPRVGAHALIAFLRPSSTHGVLVELIQSRI